MVTTPIGITGCVLSRSMRKRPTIFASASVASTSAKCAPMHTLGPTPNASLLPLLRASRPARIVNVASSGQNRIDFDNVMLTRGYDAQRAYGQSKLALIMFTFDLAQELAGSGVTANCLHPATYMDTAMVRESGITPWSTVGEGADAILHLAVAADVVERTGRYYDGLQPGRPNAQANDRAARERLRTLSMKLVGL